MTIKVSLKKSPKRSLHVISDWSFVFLLLRVEHWFWNSFGYLSFYLWNTCLEIMFSNPVLKSWPFFFLKSLAFDIRRSTFHVWLKFFKNVRRFFSPFNWFLGNFFQAHNDPFLEILNPFGKKTKNLFERSWNRL